MQARGKHNEKRGLSSVGLLLRLFCAGAWLSASTAYYWLDCLLLLFWQGHAEERENVGQGKGHANWKFPLWGRRRSLEDRDRNLFSRNCSIMSSVSAVAWHIDQWVIIIILFVCRELDQTSRSRHDALCRQAKERESPLLLFATLLTDLYDRTSIICTL